MSLSKEDLKRLVLAAEKRGDMQTAKRAMVKLRDMGAFNSVSQPAQPAPEDVNAKLAEFGDIPQVPGSLEEAEFERLTAAAASARPQKEKPTLGERVVGGIETAGSAIIGGAAGGIGQLAGGVEGAIREIATGQTGTGLAEETAELRARQLSQPFAPVTPEGQRQAGILGKALQPLSSLPPFLPGGQAAIAAMAPLSGSRIVDAAQKYAGKKSASKEYLKERIEAGDTDVSLLGKSIDGGEIVATPGIKAAQKQGFDDTVLRSIETGNPETKKAIADQVTILKRRKVDADYRASNRSTDAIGDRLYKRYVALNDLRKAKGRKVGKAAKKLEGNVDIDENRLFSELDSVGVKIGPDEDGVLKADFSDVDIANTAGTKRAVNAVLDRINRGDIDAYGAHKLKTLINDSVEFGKLPTADDKIAKGVENALKGFSARINEQLRAKSKKYANANDEYRTVIEPLSEMDRVFKSTLNVSDTNALEAGMGMKAARTIMSNNTGRAAMLSTIKRLDEALRKNNVDFKDDIIKQAVAADELERMFGTQATTSLHGQVQRADEKAIRSVFGSSSVDSTVTGLLLDAGVAGARAARGINEKNALKALDKILEQR